MQSRPLIQKSKRIRQVLQDTGIPSKQLLVDDIIVTRHNDKGHTVTYICTILKLVLDHQQSYRLHVRFQ